MNDVPQIFDQKQLARQHARAAGNYARHDFLHREMAERLSERLDDVNRQFAQATCIGMDCPQHRKITHCEKAGFSSAEILNLQPASQNLILAPVGLWHLNDLPGALFQLRHALKPDGLFLGMLFGGQTLIELRDALQTAEMEITGGITPRTAPLVDVRDAGNLLTRAGFALPVVDGEILTVSYENIFALMRDLRGMGEGNALTARQKHFTRRSIFQRAGEYMAERYADEETRITVSFELVTLTAWAPHESQQQPARRGSGKVDLKQFLND